MSAEADLAKLADLNELARQHGWREAIERSFSDEGFKAYITDPARAGFLDLLPIDDSDVLEIGPGYGQFTPAIAARAKSVEALEVDAGQAVFLAERVRQEGFANVAVTTGGSDCSLPYQDERFDLIILNLVFEWCAIRLAEDHRHAQARLLAEMHRVLRPGGRLYLATKNRFALSYLLGKPDEHFRGMRFGSALPRWLARRLHGKRQAGMLYSYQGLASMLKRAGFVVERSWWAAPEMRYPEAMVETDAKSVSAARRSGVRQATGRFEQLLMRMMPAGLVKHVAPGLSFLARKQANSSSPR